MSVDEDHEEPGSRREGSCRGPFWIRIGFLEGDVILKLESGTPKTNYQGPYSRYFLAALLPS